MKRGPQGAPEAASRELWPRKYCGVVRRGHSARMTGAVPDRPKELGLSTRAAAANRAARRRDDHHLRHQQGKEGAALARTGDQRLRSSRPRRGPQRRAIATPPAPSASCARPSAVRDGPASPLYSRQDGRRGKPPSLPPSEARQGVFCRASAARPNQKIQRKRLAGGRRRLARCRVTSITRARRQR